MCVCVNMATDAVSLVYVNRTTANIHDKCTRSRCKCRCRGGYLSSTCIHHRDIGTVYTFLCSCVFYVVVFDYHSSATIDKHRRWVTAIKETVHLSIGIWPKVNIISLKLYQIPITIKEICDYLSVFVCLCDCVIW